MCASGLKNSPGFDSWPRKNQHSRQKFDFKNSIVAGWLVGLFLLGWLLHGHGLWVWRWHALLPVLDIGIQNLEFVVLGQRGIAVGEFNPARCPVQAVGLCLAVDRRGALGRLEVVAVFFDLEDTARENVFSLAVGLVVSEDREAILVVQPLQLVLPSEWLQKAGEVGGSDVPVQAIDVEDCRRFRLRGLKGGPGCLWGVGREQHRWNARAVPPRDNNPSLGLLVDRRSGQHVVAGQLVGQPPRHIVHRRQRDIGVDTKNQIGEAALDLIDSVGRGAGKINEQIAVVGRLGRAHAGDTKGSGQLLVSLLNLALLIAVDDLPDSREASRVVDWLVRIVQVAGGDLGESTAGAVGGDLLLTRCVRALGAWVAQGLARVVAVSSADLAGLETRRGKTLRAGLHSLRIKARLRVAGLSAVVQRAWHGLVAEPTTGHRAETAADRAHCLVATGACPLGQH